MGTTSYGADLCHSTCAPHCRKHNVPGNQHLINLTYSVHGTHCFWPTLNRGTTSYGADFPLHICTTKQETGLLTYPVHGNHQRWCWLSTPHGHHNEGNKIINLPCTREAPAVVLTCHSTWAPQSKKQDYWPSLYIGTTSCGADLPLHTGRTKQEMGLLTYPLHGNHQRWRWLATPHGHHNAGNTTIDLSCTWEPPAMVLTCHSLLAPQCGKHNYWPTLYMETTSYDADLPLLIGTTMRETQ